MNNKNNLNIPISEVKPTFSRSSGAGGQNVNKTSTKATLHWSIANSRILTEEEKTRLRKKLANHINDKDELIVTCEQERSQLQNRAKAMAGLQTLAGKALYLPKKRQPTQLNKSSKLKRLKLKKLRSQLKQDRRAKE